MTWWRSLAALLCIVTALVSSRDASASSGVQAENRVGGFDLVAPTLVGLHALRGAEKHWENSLAYGESAQGYTLAAEAGVTVSREGLAAVTEHLAQFGEHAPNTAMLGRLTSQVGSVVSGADANFYTHELMEAGHMASGMSYEAAHAAALEQAGVSPFSLYHPEVIQQFPAEFNNAWRAFWGL